MPDPARHGVPARDSGLRHRPSDDDLLRARHAVRAALVPSPLIAAPALGANVWIKAESLLPTGSFKPRGALAALSALPPERKVVLSSAGNAAIAVAWAARRFNRVVRIIVPETASPAKIAKMRSYGCRRSDDDHRPHRRRWPGERYLRLGGGETRDPRRGSAGSSLTGDGARPRSRARRARRHQTDAG